MLQSTSDVQAFLCYFCKPIALHYCQLIGALPSFFFVTDKQEIFYASELILSTSCYYFVVFL